ncbi:MAG: hypothetical protein EOP22_13965 [Hyphomicrobiales bacterium]|nr:MAG: hypothetical protein EOP22_13965 [Hyphomicrobiales bacterium]
MKNIATGFGLVFGAAALVLQFALAIPLRIGNGDTLLGAVIYFFTFYTILTNIMLVLVYASDLWPRQGLRWWRSPVTRGMMAAVIVLVGLFYHFVLAGTWNPQGWSKVADVSLHYVTPIFYVLWWVLFQWHGKLKYAHIPVMLLPSTIWLVWAMARGALLNEYPYPILEAHILGYPQVALNVLIVLAGVTLLCALIVALDKALTRIDMPGP